MNKIFADIIARQENLAQQAEIYEPDTLCLVNDCTKNMSSNLFNPGDGISQTTKAKSTTTKAYSTYSRPKSAYIT